MEMSQTTIYQLSWRNKDKTQNSTASIVKNKYLKHNCKLKFFSMKIV